MYNMPTTQAKWLRDMKKSPEQRLRDKFVCEEDHKNYGVNYTEDSAKAWELYVKHHTLKGKK
jgi:hypothetical protein